MGGPASAKHGRSEKPFRLRCHQPAGEACGLFRRSRHEAWRARIFCQPPAWHKWSANPRARVMGHIKTSAALSCLHSSLFIVLRYGSRVMQLPGKFEQRLFEGRRKRRRAGAEDEDVRELKSPSRRCTVMSRTAFSSLRGERNDPAGLPGSIPGSREAR